MTDSSNYWLLDIDLNQRIYDFNLDLWTFEQHIDIVNDW